MVVASLSIPLFLQKFVAEGFADYHCRLRIMKPSVVMRNTEREVYREEKEEKWQLRERERERERKRERERERALGKE